MAQLRRPGPLQPGLLVLLPRGLDSLPPLRRALELGRGPWRPAAVTAGGRVRVVAELGSLEELEERVCRMHHHRLPLYFVIMSAALQDYDTTPGPRAAL